MEALLFLLRLVALVFGCIAFVIGVGCGRNEAGKVQSYVLNFWVGLTSLGEAATSRHARLVRGTATAALAALDWVFGKKVLSARSLWTASVLSINSMALTVLFGVGLLYWGVVHQSSWVPQTLVTETVRTLAPTYPFIFLIGGLIAVLLVIVAMWPALLARPLRPARVLVACPPVLLVVKGLVHPLFRASTPHLAQQPVAPPPASPPAHPVAVMLVFWCVMALGPLSDLFILFIARWALRRCERADEWRSGLAALLVLVTVAFVISGAPVYLLRHVGGWYVTAPTLLLAATVPMNLFDILLVSGLAAWVLVLVAHKLLWPLCSGLVEHAYELIPNRWVMMGVGLGLLTLGGWEWLGNHLKLIAETLHGG
jgi:hypothetical protein